LEECHHRLKLWDVTSGKLVLEPTLNSKAMPVTFTADGKALVLWRLKDAKLTFWDVAVAKEYDTEDEPTQVLGATGDGHTLAAVKNGRLILHDLATGTKKADIQLPQGLTEFDMATGFYSSDGFTNSFGISDEIRFRFPNSGRVMAIDYECGESGEIHLWDLATGDLEDKLVLPHPVHCMALAPDGETLVVACNKGKDSYISLWDLASRVERYSLSRCNRRINCIALSPDGRTVASGSFPVSPETRLPTTGESRTHKDKAGSTIELWDASSGSYGRRIPEQRIIHCLAFSRDSSRLAAAAGNEAVLWNLTTLEKQAEFKGQKRDVRCVAFSPDGKILAAAAGSFEGSENFDLRLWDLTTGEMLTRLPTAYASAVKTLSFSSDGRMLTALCSGSFQVFDLATRKRHALFRPDPESPLQHGQVSTIAISPEGTTVAMGGYISGYFARIGSVRVWNPITGELRATLSAHTGPVTTVLITPTGKTLLAGGSAARSTELKLLDVQTEEQLAVVPNSLTRAFSPDGRLLATRELDAKDSVTVRQASTGQKLAQFDHSGLTYVYFSPDGETLATTGGGAVRLWDLSGAMEVIKK
jgi:WD40 repeat protein